MRREVPRRFVWTLIPYVLLLPLALILATALTPAVESGANRPADDTGAAPPMGSLDPTTLTAACRTTNPFLAVARFADPDDPDYTAAPAVLALRDTPSDDLTEHVVLATRAQVGAVFGLAYDHGRGHLYAAAYHKRGVPFGPGGPGAIYRIDVATGDVATWATVPAGPDRHDLRRDDDDAAAEWVGRSSLGDIELAADGSQLLVANLFDGRIYRYAVPDGALLGQFAHGATGTAPAYNLRLFGLGSHEGWLYHAVVSLSSGDAEDETFEQAELYRSRADGSGMERVARSAMSVPVLQDMLTDVAVLDNDTVLLTWRGVATDAWVDETSPGAGVFGLAGGILAFGRVEGEMMPIDAPAISGAAGGLAVLPGQAVVSVPVIRAEWVAEPLPTPGVIRWVYAPRVEWWSLADVEPLRTEPLAVPPDPAGTAPPQSLLGVVSGDVEVLCAARTALDPDLGATATLESVERGTATAAAEATAIPATQTAAATHLAGTITAIAPTLTAYASRAPALATAGARTATAVARGTSGPATGPLQRFQDACDTRQHTYYAVPVHARDASLARLSREPAIVAFNDKGDKLTLADQSQVGTLYGVAYDWRRGHLYVSAYHKRGAVPGPAGLGAIYRLDLRTEMVMPWVVTNTGPDVHGTADFDAVAAPWVGKIGYGDIELAEDGSQLFAVNMLDGKIYRFSVPDGKVLGAFSNGGLRESWGIQARPMALGVREGVLYHGVVNSRELGLGRLEAVVYRSDAEGQHMAAVTRVFLNYHRPVTWGDWRDTDTYAQMLSREALLSDLEWTAPGDLLLGFRDRVGDSRPRMFEAFGDLLPTRLTSPGSPRAVTVPEFYRDNHIGYEPLWGALAAEPYVDRVVSTSMDPETINSGGAVWFDNTSGARRHAETIYHTTGADLTFAKAQGLGDLEALCPPEKVPTLTPSPTGTATPTGTPTPPSTPTSTPTFTATATATATPTATPSHTPTPVPTPLYLPFADRRPCRPEERFADVVLVLDMSTSMYRETRSGRSKHEAAIEAAWLFTDLMDLESLPDDERMHDRVGVVGFNDVAWTEVGLTENRQAVQMALNQLMRRIQEGTRLDLALREGQAAIEAGGRRQGVTPVLVLLTDGLPNRVPYGPGGTMEETVVAEAVAARDAGTRIFTVGLGLPDDVLRGLLEAVASDPRDYYYAPDGDDLAGIYRQIAGRITACP